MTQDRTKLLVILSLWLVTMTTALSQQGSISGVITIDDETVEMAQIVIDSSYLGASSNHLGKYTISNVPYGRHTITASFIGYAPVSQSVVIHAATSKATIDFSLTEPIMQIDDIVVTGTKTSKRQTESPVIVNVVNSTTIENVQACNLSEGLKFQPGLRVETDCQTCNYTQLRMNGLAGSYSQILINGRPIFSPLTGLYGLEQLPANMIDRIEVVRGGGSSLYGSSAIGGTVNVMTKIPRTNSYSVDLLHQNINGQTNDRMVNGNATIVSPKKNAGISLLTSFRDRDFYDANDDQFSEIPLLQNRTLGANMYLMPAENQKIELSISNIHEYRFGGEMNTDIPAHLTQQSEERTHNVWMVNTDYQINFNDENTSIITYAAYQQTDRQHYTGIIPDEGTSELVAFLANPPYGTSDVTTINTGAQLDHRLTNFVLGPNKLTIGTEYVFDHIIDDIPAYNYLIDQATKNLGAFIQSDWQLASDLTLLTGVRMDHHNLTDKIRWSPRMSVLYRHRENTQLRFSYGTGFRAPQAFDTDLHIAFAGGGISRVQLSPDLAQETSQSLSASINYDQAMPRWVAGFTFEAFYNRLNDAFFLQPIGEDAFGEVFEKQNGDGATVKGLTLELRANYDRKVQLEGGFNLQNSLFDSPVQYIDGLQGLREFVRTPNDYGYAILSITPHKQWSTTINYVYTGTMKVPHFAGAPNQTVDEIITSPTFSDMSIKTSYTLPLKSNISIYGGIKNIFNAYQDDFDIGKNRDSNYVYGPGQPRAFYVGVRIKS